MTVPKLFIHIYAHSLDASGHLPLHRGMTPEERKARNAAILELDAQHKPASVIAARLGLTRCTVAGILFRHGSWAKGVRISKGGRPRRAPATPRVVARPAAKSAEITPGEAFERLCATFAPAPRITMAELTPAMCKYPCGDPKDWDAFRFCGKPVYGFRHYCREHYDLCHQDIFHIRQIRT